MKFQRFFSTVKPAFAIAVLVLGMTSPTFASHEEILHAFLGHLDQERPRVWKGRRSKGFRTKTNWPGTKRSWTSELLILKRHRSYSVPVGRELACGATRWVSVREAPTVHQSFDAARAIVTAASWQVDAFLSKPAATNVGVFDDHTDRTRTFWGIYATGPFQRPKSHIDLYYFGLHHSDARFQQGTAFERRQIIGTRIWGTSGPRDYDVELPKIPFAATLAST